MAYRIRRDGPIDDEFRRILSEEIERGRSDIRELDENPVRAVHQLRKRCKRIRAVLALFRESLGSWGRAEDHRIRGSARSLSKVRTIHALREVSDQLGLNPPGAKKPITETGTADLGMAIERDFAALEIDIATRFSFQIDKPALINGLARIHRQSRSTWRAARRDPTTARLHEWRKATKRFWYAIRLTQDLAGKPPSKLRRNLASTGSLLGRHHDLSMLSESLAAAHTRETARDPNLDSIQNRRTEIETKVLSLGSKVHRKRSLRFAQRHFRAK